jgi:hypothetical protein
MFPMHESRYKLTRFSLKPVLQIAVLRVRKILIKYWDQKNDHMVPKKIGLVYWVYKAILNTGARSTDLLPSFF